MARIESEATRMGALVEDLLALARLDELPESRCVSVDITDLASQAVADARATAPTRPVVLESPDGLMVLGDPDSLHQVLGNLMSNALIHTPDGTPIELAVHRDGPDAVVEVIDHGPGLPPGAEEHVFERVWRADGARTRGAGGSGLGLSIVREIVHAHHGSVGAQNRDGGGAQFTVRLPVAPPQSPSSEARGERPPSPRVRALS
jgi:two-component system OmpR family sensor kinase